MSILHLLFLWLYSSRSIKCRIVTAYRKSDEIMYFFFTLLVYVSAFGKPADSLP